MSKSILVTGVAGFIGFHVVKALLKQGCCVVGVDSLVPYYDVALKEARLAELQSIGGNFHFYQQDLSDHEALLGLSNKHPDIRSVIHLAAQPGVRYSLEKPFEYAQHNIIAHLSVLELCRALQMEHCVYASSSSVYGHQDIPFSTKDAVNTPLSLYAATKVADEAMSYSYAHLYRFPATGLRFFTVYGPWGRPDMAVYLFTKAIAAGRPIQLFGEGLLKRDFTYIDDIVQGILNALANPAKEDAHAVPHAVYNLGNCRTESVITLVKTIEEALGKKADIIYAPMQAGDMKETYADITESARDLAFAPSVSLQEGVKHFVRWFEHYHA